MGLSIFVHIPKTAGSSIRQLIAENYDVKKQFMFLGPYSELQDVYKDPKILSRQKLEVIHGHHPYGIAKLFPDRDSTYFTLLRDPYKRMISEYFFAFKEDSGFHPFIKNKKMSLERFTDGHIKVLDNPMCRWIAGIHPREKSTLGKGEVLELAKKRLIDEFQVYGITEFFDESMLLIAKEMNWKAPIYLKQNIGDKPRNIEQMLSDTVKGQIHEMIKYDQELYDFALKHWKERVCKESSSFWRALSNLQQVNKQIQADHKHAEGKIFIVGENTMDLSKYYDQCSDIRDYFEQSTSL